jgi:hypothetical protein
MKNIRQNKLLFIVSIFLSIVLILFFNQRKEINKLTESQKTNGRFEKDEYCRKTYRSNFEERLKEKLFKSRAIEEFYSIQDVFFSPSTNECFIKYKITTYLENESGITSRQLLQKAVSDDVWDSTSADIGEDDYLRFMQTEKELRGE